MAKEYIPREAALKEYITMTEYDEGVWGDNVKVVKVDAIKAIPAADVVEVEVRCKDCKYGWKCCSGAIACQRDGRVAYEMLFEPTSYCSYGERRDGGADE